MINPEFLEAHADRLRRDYFPRTASALPCLYASLPPKKARKMVDKLKRLEDAEKPFPFIPGFVDEITIEFDKEIQAILDRYAPLSPAGLYRKRPPLAKQLQWNPPPKNRWPHPLDRLPSVEAHLIMRMIHTPDLFALIRTAPQWDKGHMRAKGSAVTDGAHRLKSFRSGHAAYRMIEKMERRAFSRPPVQPLSFAECRQRYDPLTRLVRTDG